MTMMQGFDQPSRDPVTRTVNVLLKRLEAMNSDFGLHMRITPGPIFVLLAQAVGGEDFYVPPEESACKAAAQKLSSARPGGYVISDGTGRKFPSKTFGSDFPDDQTEDRYAYVHVSEDAMVEVVSGELAVKPSGEVVGLGLIEEWIRERDAVAICEAFDELEVDGDIVVTVAMLRTDGSKVLLNTTAPKRVGILHVPYVTTNPLCVPARQALNAENLKGLVRDLWAEVVRHASAT